MRYQDFSLQIVPRLLNRYMVYAQSWQGEAKGPFEPPPEWGGTADGIGRRRRKGHGPVRDAGQGSPGHGFSEVQGEQLFQSLFPPEVLRLYERSLDRARESPESGLRVKLMLDPGDPELQGLWEFPWEELRQPGRPEFLALSRCHSIVRYPMVPLPIQAAERPSRLRILVSGASPRGENLPPLDLQRERQNLAKALEDAAGLEIADARLERGPAASA